MNQEKRNIEFIDEKVERREQKVFSFKDIIDGTMLTKDYVVRQIPFLLFLTFLGFIYIGNRYRAEKIVRQTVVLQNEMNELRAEAITISSELMFLSKQSEVIKLVKDKGLDLEESLEPPRKIIIKYD